MWTAGSWSQDEQTGHLFDSLSRSNPSFGLRYDGHSDARIARQCRFIAWAYYDEQSQLQITTGTWNHKEWHAQSYPSGPFWYHAKDDGYVTREDELSRDTYWVTQYIDRGWVDDEMTYEECMECMECVGRSDPASDTMWDGLTYKGKLHINRYTLTEWADSGSWLCWWLEVGGQEYVLREQFSTRSLTHSWWYESKSSGACNVVPGDGGTGDHGYQTGDTHWRNDQDVRLGRFRHAGYCRQKVLCVGPKVDYDHSYAHGWSVRSVGNSTEIRLGDNGDVVAILPTRVDDDGEPITAYGATSYDTRSVGAVFNGLNGFGTLDTPCIQFIVYNDGEWRRFVDGEDATMPQASGLHGPYRVRKFVPKRAKRK